MTRPDSTQAEIVSALRRAGISVWILGTPCDLLTYNPRTQLWKLLEVKPTDLHNAHRKDQGRQREFVATYAIPIVRTFQEAAAALGIGG
jgi:hypothetical protein